MNASIKYPTCVCVCVWARARACVRACVHVGVWYRSKGVRDNSKRFTHKSKKKITTTAVGLFISWSPSPWYRKIELIPTTPYTLLNPPVSGPLLRQLRAIRMTVGPRAVQSKKRSKQLTWERKGLTCKKTETLTHVFESRWLMYDT